jgi:hypothetical protein
MLELALPAYNEAETLELSVRRLHASLCEHFPFSWRIAIVDNASTGDTLAIGRRPVGKFSGIRMLHLDLRTRDARHGVDCHHDPATVEALGTHRGTTMASTRCRRWRIDTTRSRFTPRLILGWMPDLRPREMRDRPAVRSDR